MKRPRGIPNDWTMEECLYALRWIEKMYNLELIIMKRIKQCKRVLKEANGKI